MSVDCRECTSMIGDFLEDRLDNIRLREFLKHMEECTECQEELADHYLVYKGLEKLETGGDFDLVGDLNEERDKAWARLTARRRLFRFASALEIITVSIFLIVFGLVILS